MTEQTEDGDNVLIAKSELEKLKLEAETVISRRELTGLIYTNAKTMRESASLFTDAVIEFAMCGDLEEITRRRDELMDRWSHLKAAYRLLDIAVSGA